MDDTDRQLSFVIGEMVRNDVYLENEIRYYRLRLQDAGLPLKDPPSKDEERPKEITYGTALEQLRVKVAKHPLPEEYRSIALDAIAQATEMHQLRNDVAHRLLMVDHRKRDHYRRMRSSTSPRPMAELEQNARDILNAMSRVRGLAIITPFWLGMSYEDFETATDLRPWTRVAMGYVDLSATTVTGTPGDSPEPPRGYPHPSPDWPTVSLPSTSARRT